MKPKILSLLLTLILGTIFSQDTTPTSAIFPKDQEPIFLNLEEIRDSIGYPMIARDAGIEGSVIVRVLMDKEGNYVRHKIIHQVHPILTNAVEKYIGSLKSSPAIVDGKITNYWVNIPFNFHLISRKKKKRKKEKKR